MRPLRSRAALISVQLQMSASGQTRTLRFLTKLRRFSQVWERSCARTVLHRTRSENMSKLERGLLSVPRQRLTPEEFRSLEELKHRPKQRMVSDEHRERLTRPEMCVTWLRQTQ